MRAKQLTACLGGMDARRTGALTPAASLHFLPPPYCIQALVPPKARPKVTGARHVTRRVFKPV